MLASLNHPHICTLHDLGRDGATDFLVMELLEGATLAERLTKGPLPLAPALTIAREIADALDKAHRHGIVHRDLKPGNVVLTKSGAKLLDFGLAKGTRTVVAGNVSQAATAAAAPMTAEGTIVGTPNYMAPEQIEGREADARSDLWALGCVMYEMLAGSRPFDGRTSVSVMAAILEREPEPLRARQPTTPAVVEHVIARCLTKDPDERWQSARDVLGELQWIGQGTTAEPTAAVPRSRFASIMRAGLWLTVGALIASAVAASWRAVPPDAAPVMQFDIAAEGPMTLSPDGRYVATGQDRPDGRTRISLRTLTEGPSRYVVELEGAYWWAWTPDNVLHVGVPNGVRTIDPRSGASLFQPGKWATTGAHVALGDGRFVVGRTGGVAFPLQIWSAAGQQENATTVDTAGGERRHVFPAPAGSGAFTFQMERNDGATFVCAGRVGQPHHCDGPTNHADFALYSQGHVLYRRSGGLIVRPFDLARGKFTGAEHPIPITSDGSLGVTWMSASLTGAVVFGVASLTDRFSWVDRSGRETQAATTRRAANFVLAPDGTRVALEQSGTLALLDLRGGGTTILGPSLGNPIWSPDGRRVAHRTRAGVVLRSIDDPTETTLYTPAAGFSAFPKDWSPDGRWIAAVLTAQDFGGVLIPAGGGEPRLILPAADRLERPDEFSFSPDGRWFAFNAFIGGRPEVFVTPNPPTGRRWQVSNAGGMQPQWGGNGDLFYLTPDGTMMSVQAASGSDFKPTAPRALFKTGLSPSSGLSQYAITGDGRFLIKRLDGADRAAVRAIVNWPSLARP